MAEATDADIRHLEQLIAVLTQRLRMRETQIAIHGMAWAPPEIVLDKQAAEQELAHIRAELFRLRPHHRPARNPYKGLLTFDEVDADRFFGREALVAELVEKARRTSFLAVLGSSGSGKSSVVRAGLIPMLKGGVLPDSERWLYLPIVTPGERPLNELATALNTIQAGTLGDVETVCGVLRQKPDALVLAASHLRAGQANVRLVLVVDQAEELWTLMPTDPATRQTWQDEQQQPFLHVLLTAIHAGQGNTVPPVLVVLTLRADFLHRAAEERNLAPLIAEHDVIVGPMAPGELRRTIVRPADLVGGQFELGLVDELIAETQQQDGTLPLLEYTLQQLWESCATNSLMTWTAYRTLGGVVGALAREADMLLKQHYQPDEQADLRAILLRLVQPDEGGADTRRRVRLDDLIPAGATREIVQARLQPLINARLLTTGRDDQDNDTVQVAHEALIRAWPALRDWIAAGRADLRLQRQLEEAAREWQDSGENSDLLWQGLRLSNAEAWVSQARPMLLDRENQFLQASQMAERARVMAERQRTRRIIAGLITALVLITTFAGGTFWFWQRAERENHINQAQLLMAEGQGRYALDRPLLGLRLMLEGLVTLPAGETETRDTFLRTAATTVSQGRLVQLADDVVSIAASPDSTLLVVARRDKAGELWRSDGTRLAVLAGPLVSHKPDPFEANQSDRPAVVFNATSTLVAVGYADNHPAELWRSDGTRLVGSLATDRYGQPAVVFSENGTLVAVRHTDGTYELWHSDGTHLPPLTGVFADRPGQPAVSFSSNGTLVVVRYTGHRPAELWRSDGTRLAVLAGPLADDRIGRPAVVFNAASTLVAIKYADNTSAELRRNDGTRLPLAGPLAVNSGGDPACGQPPSRTVA